MKKAKGTRSKTKGAWKKLKGLKGWKKLNGRLKS